MYAMLIGLRAKATAIPVPRDTDVECSAASANDRNGSLVVSAAQTQSSPARLGGGHPVGHPGQLHPEAAVDLHRGRLLTPARDADAVVAFLIRRRTGAGVGAGPLTAGASTDNDSGSPTCTKRPAAGCR